MFDNAIIYFNELFTELQKKTIRKFCKVLVENAENYDYVVFTTRRCFCFVNYILSAPTIFGLNENNISVLKSKSVSSQAIDILGQEFENKKVLLCDDIMIHGQSVYHHYDQICQYAPSELDVLVMLRNIEKPDYFQLRTSSNYKIVAMVTAEEWERYSNAIVEFIHYTGCLYVSYIYGFKLDFDYVEKNIVKKYSLKPILYKNDLFAYKFYLDNLEPQYYEVDLKSVFGDSNSYEFNYIRYSVLRIYRIPKSSKCWIVPYVELKNIYIEALNNSYENLLCISNYKSSLFKNLNLIKKEADRYKAITAILSILLFRKLNINEDFKVSTFIDESFYDGFYESVKDLDVKQTLDVFENLNVCDEVGSVEKSIMERLLLEISFDQDIEKVFKDFFAQINKTETVKFNEVMKSSNSNSEKFNCLKEYFKPLSVNKFYSSFAPQGVKAEQLSIILTFMDCGILSLIVNQNQNSVGLSVKAGEQSYHLIADIAKEYFKTIWFLYSFLKNVPEEEKCNLIKSFLTKIRDEQIDLNVFEYFLSNANRDFGEYSHYYFGIDNLTPQFDQSEPNRILKKACGILKELIQ